MSYFVLAIKGTQLQLRAIEKSLSLRVRKTPEMEMQTMEFPNEGGPPLGNSGDANEVEELKQKLEEVLVENQELLDENEKLNAILKVPASEVPAAPEAEKVEVPAEVPATPSEQPAAPAEQPATEAAPAEQPAPAEVPAEQPAAEDAIEAQAKASKAVKAKKA